MEKDIEANDTTERNDTEDIRDLFTTPIGHFPDRSARWLFKDKDNVRGLIEIVANELVEYLDFNGLVELNRSFVSDTLQELESDMVFSIPFQDASDTAGTDELLVYILIEHQSTVDPMMAFRLLFYMCQIWETQRRELEESGKPKSGWRLRPILPIVYYTGDQRWQTPLSLSAIMEVPEVLSRFVPKFDTLLLGVKDTDPDDLKKTGHPLGWLLTVLQKENADRTSMWETLHKAHTYIATLDTMSDTQKRNAFLYLCFLVLFTRPAEERDDLMQLVRTHIQDKEVENIIMTGAEAFFEQGKMEGIEQGKMEGIEQGKMEGIEQGKMEGIEQGKMEGIEQGKMEGIEQGKTEGIEQGKTEGKVEAKQAAVIRLLRHRFLEVNDTIINEIGKIEDLSRLDTLFEQVLDASTLDDVDVSNRADKG